MEKLSNLSNNLDGRDKLYKAIQYLLKIVLSTSSNKESIDKLTVIFSKYTKYTNHIYTYINNKTLSVTQEKYLE